MSKEYSYTLQILERHLDSFGHVNNATYLELYEQARWEFITKNGYGLDRIHQLQLGPVLLEAHLFFRRELVNREVITIKSRSTGMKGRLMMGLEQIMEKSNGELASKLDITVGLFDMKKRKLIEPTPEWLAAIGEISVQEN